MALNPEQVARIKRMKRDELLSNAQTEDLGVLVETVWRLHRTTWVLNAILIVLAAAIVYAAFAFGHV
jgi:hypothetical protein